MRAIGWCLKKKKNTKAIVTRQQNVPNSTLSRNPPSPGTQLLKIAPMRRAGINKETAHRETRRLSGPIRGRGGLLKPRLPAAFTIVALRSLTRCVQVKTRRRGPILAKNNNLSAFSVRSPSSQHRVAEDSSHDSLPDPPSRLCPNYARGLRGGLGA